MVVFQCICHKIFWIPSKCNISFQFFKRSSDKISHLQSVVPKIAKIAKFPKVATHGIWNVKSYDQTFEKPHSYVSNVHYFRISCAMLVGINGRILRPSDLYVVNGTQRRHRANVMSPRQFYHDETNQTGIKLMHPSILRRALHLWRFSHLKQGEGRQRERRPHRCAEGRK